MPGNKSNKKYGMGMGKHKPIELELPSTNDDGEPNVCLVRRPGVQGLIRMGLLDNLDQLTSLVTSKIDELKGVAKAQEIDAEAVKKLAENKESIDYALSLIDKIVVGCVVDPRVYALPPEGEARDADRLYIDEVELEDKVFIMNFAVGGSADLTSFRDFTNSPLEYLGAGQGVQGNPSEPAGD